MAAEKRFPFGQPSVWKPSDEYLRRVIRVAYLGEPPGDLSALVNPEAVEEIQRAA
jgi:acetyl-CoA synthetase